MGPDDLDRLGEGSVLGQPERLGDLGGHLGSGRAHVELQTEDIGQFDSPRQPRVMSVQHTADRIPRQAGGRSDPGQGPVADRLAYLRLKLLKLGQCFPLCDE